MRVCLPLVGLHARYTHEEAGYSGRAHCWCKLRVSLRCESWCWGAQPRVQGLYTGLVRSGQAWGREPCSGSTKRKA